ncbi:SDR family oxidoreductase [Roseicella aerolata]|uniref:SDR family oxidoreductase n=1 Tax=Roseicella aerolata TaxID=2883479 RepID=A0A9X1IGL4_9PROT|nr:SDR family oxidoreductase [Roseicella aerolata]MCB4824235.1 SDR family oxidoreductase [Roseicella aerolata]
MLSPDTLAGRRILVTGGGTGLGRSMARRFVELGAAVTICGRRAEVLEATAAAFRAELGAELATERCDVRDATAVEAMLDRIWARGPLDVLVNNAAGNFLAQTHRLSPRAVDAVVDIVLKGSAWCTLGCGRRWIEAGRGGTVLSILTLSALQGGAFTVPSAMAKAGVLAMTQSLAVEWGPKGIRLVAIAPGNVPTPDATARLQVEAAGAVERGIPLRRVGEHRELADLAAFLVSDMAAYITGETVVIDGGKRFLGGARSGSDAMLDWSDADWAAYRARQGR